MVGAAMVGSIVQTAPEKRKLKKGAEFGYYQFGGSTNIMILPASCALTLDADILRNSKAGVETLVDVGEQIGRIR
jgi:phosphatidylserine decarboxylase